MLVYFVTDEPAKLPAIRAMLEPQHAVVPWVLDSDGTGVRAHGVLMVDVDLRQMPRADQLKLILQELAAISERLFVVPNHARSMVAQAYALGATAVISRAKEAALKIAQIEYAEAAKEKNATDPAMEMDAGVAAFASMFSNVRHGRPLKIADARRATSQIVKRVGQDGLSTWLDEVRRYHEGTFQHCLLVTGVAVAFGLDVGFSSADVSRLGMAATLHDIGKARIPLSILDKPGRLDPDEDEIIRRHPVIGYELLKGVSDVSPEILDGVRHHHEYLDGSGYPDGLKGSQISDLVRLLTISDIFAALVESRAYKTPMPRSAAYEILCGMEGKLEGALVRAFRKVALG
ncbi:HD domain-containing protein [Bradyrhizobium sp. WSM 1738]|uniref:HD-GYP domain-containing protein n=1 Tax=Bradyrhizobium hereditatis TaxID=2821405 RepID=UPI001CE2AB89|nr:HD domain-containing phosphohydrolase [Bradyrhizobium hereditatis]MCA6116061.1 HD domain-containing protein [Bradyrhizobium hereditatis]